MTDMTERNTETTDFAAHLPEKFRDPETGAVRIDALLNSYLELERKLSSRPSAPETPDDYEIDVSHGLFTVDPEVNAHLHQNGMTQDQAQAVYDLAARKLVPVVREIAQQFAAEREVDKLADAFGGPEKWHEVSRQLLAWGQKNLPPQALESLSNSYDGVMALYNMMKAQEPGSQARTDGPAPAASGDDLRAMMRDPRYWRDKDPAFIAQVTDGFGRVYGQ